MKRDLQKSDTSETTAVVMLAMQRSGPAAIFGAADPLRIGFVTLLPASNDNETRLRNIQKSLRATTDFSIRFVQAATATRPCPRIRMTVRVETCTATPPADEPGFSHGPAVGSERRTPGPLSPFSRSLARACASPGLSYSAEPETLSRDECLITFLSND